MFVETFRKFSFLTTSVDQLSVGNFHWVNILTGGISPIGASKTIAKKLAE